MGLLILLYPFAELYVLVKFIQAFSFWDAFLYALVSAGVGIVVLRLLGPATMSLLKNEMARGQVPAGKILHRGLVMVGAILLIVPGLISDVMGALLILPGTRHLAALYLARLFKKGLFNGRVFVGGLGGFGNPGGFRPPPGGFPPGGFPPGWEEPREERDAQVIDVEPLEITHKPK